MNSLLRHSLCPLLSLPLITLCCAADEYPWSNSAPEDIVRNALTPDLVLDESASDWRPAVGAIFKPLVKNCRSAREAVLTIAANMTKATGVIYSRERRQPCMNATEALAEKKVSCTGQSILLVCALRSVGIPARAVGLLTWNHIRGNHTWVEAWFDGEWHMIEFNEKDFNTPWVMEYLSMLDPRDPAQHIWAATDEPTGHYFPAVWNRDSRIPAIDVTERYIRLARAWSEQNGQDPAKQKLMVELLPRPESPTIIQLIDSKGNLIDEAPLPGPSDDIRKLATLQLPRSGTHYLRLKNIPGSTLPVSPTDNAVQILHLRRSNPTPSAPTAPSTPAAPTAPATPSPQP